MVSIGILGINYKTGDLSIREAIARAARTLSGERALFLPYPTVLLSTCNRTEVYFSADDLAWAHSHLLAHLRAQIGESFEHRLYSYFGSDCFFHLCRVAAGLDSAILGETEIQRQVKMAYAQGTHFTSCLHYVFQKALKVSKEVRHWLNSQRGGASLYGILWQLANWQGKKVLLVGYSEINRGLMSFLIHKGIDRITVCTRHPAQVTLSGIEVVGRDVLASWQNYDVIVCASKSDHYLISGQGKKEQVLFDLSVPRNVDPEVGAVVYNIEQIHQWIDQERSTHTLHPCEVYIRERVHQLVHIYEVKTQGVREIAEMGSRL